MSIPYFNYLKTCNRYCYFTSNGSFKKVKKVADIYGLICFGWRKMSMRPGNQATVIQPFLLLQILRYGKMIGFAIVFRFYYQLSHQQAVTIYKRTKLLNKYPGKQIAFCTKSHGGFFWKFDSAGLEYYCTWLSCSDSTFTGSLANHLKISGVNSS